ncbi:MAG: glycosyltransferase [Chthoniobacterales bacterium]
MRIVFASLGSLGDLHPLLALARAAADRGHHPVIATSECFEEYVTDRAFEFQPIRPKFAFEPALVERLFHPTRGPARLMREQVFPNVRETYADLLAASERADLLVVGELLYVAPLVAAELSIPWANAILAPTSFLSAEDPCVLAPVPGLYPLRHLGRFPYRLTYALGRFVTRRWGARLAAFSRELGHPIKASAIFDAKHSPLLTLALFPQFLAAPQSDWPAQTIQTGFPFFEQPIAPAIQETLDQFFDQGAPPLVFTLGSSVVHIAKDFYATAASVATDLGRRAILLTGSNPHPPDPPDSVLCVDYAPLDRVLPRSAGLIHQGGIGTCAEALRWGIPSVVIPFGFDQPDNAERLRKLGVATVIPRRKFSPTSLAQALKRLDSIETKSYADQIHPRTDLATSLDALESLIASHPTPPPTSLPETPHV